jgi:fibronectin type 3 domain-containing protein
LLATDGTVPYKWSITSGSLPAGVTLAAATGTIAGTPTTSGTHSFAIHVTDSASPATTDSANFSITIAAAADHSVMLKWTASPSPGVTGYNVYRSTVSGSGYSKITPSPVGGLSYTDATVVNGQTYYYVTTSVNAAGDESSYSTQVKMTIP